MNNGIGSLATEFRYTDGRKPAGDLIYVDYAKIGEGYGLKTYTCTTAEELEAALLDAKRAVSYTHLSGRTRGTGDLRNFVWRLFPFGKDSCFGSQECWRCV